MLSSGPGHATDDIFLVELAQQNQEKTWGSKEGSQTDLSFVDSV